MIHPAELIERKRNGEELPAEELAELILGYARGEVPDYQLAAFCMAVYFRGMTPAETLALTQATLPFVEALARDGLESAVRADPRLMAGLQVHAGRITVTALGAESRPRLRRGSANEGTTSGSSSADRRFRSRRCWRSIAAGRWGRAAVRSPSSTGSRKSLHALARSMAAVAPVHRKTASTKTSTIAMPASSMVSSQLARVNWGCRANRTTMLMLTSTIQTAAITWARM